MKQHRQKMLVISLLLISTLTTAETYLVGATQTYTSLQEITDLLEPGDVVRVDGNATYEAGAYFSNNGTEEKWITISGIQPEGGTRPKITGSEMYGINISERPYRVSSQSVLRTRKGYTD